MTQSSPDQPSSPTSSPAGWERETILRLATAGLTEQRRARRWSIFFRLLGFIYVAVLIGLYSHVDFKTAALDGKHTAVVNLSGIIADGDEASADNVIRGLRAAFEDSSTVGVVLRINSPGGSPVQAGYIYDEILRLRGKYPAIPLYAVVQDICASGGMYVASAADRIYVDKASIVGSIGVRLDSFGLVGTMEKMGVERRLFTAGANKGLLDPFLPLNEIEVKHIQDMLGQVHQQFIAAVKKGRGDRLKDDPQLFTGLIWTGEEAIKLGLADSLGSTGSVARDIFKAETTVDYTIKRSWIDRVSEQVGASMGTAVSSYFEAPRLR